MNIHPIFSSYLAVKKLDVDHDAIADWILEQNKTLETDVNDKVDSDGDKVTLNFSEENLFPLYHQVISAFNTVHNEIGLSNQYYQEFISGWATIDNAPRTSEPHQHVGCSMVGVYYPRATEGSGLLELRNPVYASEWAYPSSKVFNVVGDWTQFTSQTENITPQQGYLVIFPPWVMHRVLPNKPNASRISMAFNCILKPKKEEL